MRGQEQPLDNLTKKVYNFGEIGLGIAVMTQIWVCGRQPPAHPQSGPR